MSNDSILQMVRQWMARCRDSDQPVIRRMYEDQLWGAMYVLFRTGPRDVAEKIDEFLRVNPEDRT